MLRVGLTGSIAVGKSNVSKYLKELGCQVLDADQIARSIVEPGTPAFIEVVDFFGIKILTEEGTLNRKKLGKIVFTNPLLRQHLNAITHPRIHAEQERLIAKIIQTNPQAIIVIDAALLIESGEFRHCNKIIVVWCSIKEQLQRLINRNQFTRVESIQRIKAQMSSREKLKYADYKINTSGNFEETFRQSELIYLELRKLAK